VRSATGGAAHSIQVLTIKLYDKAIDSMLATPHQVSSRDEALTLLSKEGDTEAVASQIQKLALMLTPIVRRVAATRKVPGVKRIPFAAGAITVASISTAIRSGVRDVQVIGSYLASRVEQVSGRPADPRLVKKLTVDLYLHPGRQPAMHDRRIRLTGLLRTWILKGAFGRDVTKQARKAVGAVEKLDVGAVMRAWSSIPATAR
jgi:hypothetical protein